MEKLLDIFPIFGVANANLHIAKHGKSACPFELGRPMSSSIVVPPENGQIGMGIKEEDWGGVLKLTRE